MPPTRTDFEQMFAAFKKKLSSSIEGRETSNEPVKPDATDKREIALSFKRVPVNRGREMFDSSFVIHSDCPCSAINNFLSVATIDNVTLAEGPKGGVVLGVSGNAIKHFYAYKID